MPVNETELLESLKKLIPSQFDQVVFRLEINEAELSNRTQAQKAIDVIKSLKQRPDGLAQLEGVLKEILPNLDTSPPHQPPQSPHAPSSSYKSKRTSVDRRTFLIAAAVAVAVAVPVISAIFNLFLNRQRSPAVDSPNDQELDINATYIENDREIDCGSKKVWTFNVGDSTITMIKIPWSWKFKRGSPPTEKGRVENESPILDVKLSDSYYMSMYPITQAQWKAVADLNKVDMELNPEPSTFSDFESQKEPLLPVETISWEEAKEFCKRLSNYFSKTFRLPTEAEWEYACRAGTPTPFHFGTQLYSVDMVSQERRFWANYDHTYDYMPETQGKKNWSQTTPAEHFKGNRGKIIANQFGLVDMHGNVWEWCEDAWHNSYEGARPDGTARQASKGEYAEHRVLRGGAWNSSPNSCRSASRNHKPKNIRMNNVGFRIVLTS